MQRTLRDLMTDATGTEMPGSTVAEFFKSYVSRRRIELAESTVDFYEYNAQLFLEWCAANLPRGTNTQLAAFTAKNIEDYRAYRFTVCSASTTNHTMKFMKQIFSAAVREGMLLESPLANFGKIRNVDAAEIQPFSLDQVRTLLAAANDEWRSIILFGLYTGQRLGDICLLDWKNINLPAGEATFVARKGAKRMLIPLAVPLIAQLANTAVLDRLGPLHPWAHASFVRNARAATASKAFFWIMVRAGICEPPPPKSKRKRGGDIRAKRERRPFCFHSLRHSATSLLADGGAPQKVAMEIIGHRSEIVHRRYSHLGNDTLRRAVSLLPAL